MSELETVINRRRNALLNTFLKNKAPPVVQWETLEGLSGSMFLEEFEAVEGEEQLGRRNPKSVGILKGSGDPDTSASVWVAAKYKGYRSAYLAFAKTAYGISATPQDLTGYDVDHLLNRKRAGDEEVYLRIEAVPSKINQLWGTVFEKAASTSNYDGNKRVRRLMSTAIAAKLAGLPPPTGSADKVGIRKIADHFAAMGMDHAQVTEDMVTLLEKVEFFA